MQLRILRELCDENATDGLRPLNCNVIIDEKIWLVQGIWTGGLAECLSAGLIATQVGRLTASHFAGVFVGVESLRRDRFRCVSKFSPRVT